MRLVLHGKRAARLRNVIPARSRRKSDIPDIFSSQNEQLENSPNQLDNSEMSQNSKLIVTDTSHFENFPLTEIISIKTTLPSINNENSLPVMKNTADFEDTREITDSPSNYRPVSHKKLGRKQETLLQEILSQRQCFLGKKELDLLESTFMVSFTKNIQNCIGFSILSKLPF